MCKYLLEKGRVGSGSNHVPQERMRGKAGACRKQEFCTMERRWRESGGEVGKREKQGADPGSVVTQGSKGLDFMLQTREDTETERDLCMVRDDSFAL